MTHLKKSLALLLAFVMIFSSMTVAASAWSVGDDGTTVSFEIKFFRQDSKTGDWIETTNAAPGEKVKARLYIDTDYYAFSSEIALLFDSRFFDNPDFSSGVLKELVTNSDYLSGSLGLKTYDTAIWHEDETNFRQNKVTTAYPNGRLVDSGVISADYFDNFDLIYTQLNFGDIAGCSKFVGDDWTVEFDLQVRDTSYTKALNTEGTARVPKELTCSSSAAVSELFVNVPQGPEGERTNSIVPMMSWEPIVNTTPGVLTTTSSVILDGNGGRFSDDSLTSELSGIIGTAYSGLYDDANKPTKPGYVFTGWSAFDILPSEGQALSENILDSINYSNLSEAEIAAIGWTLTPAMCQILEDDFGFSYEPGTSMTSGHVKLLGLKSMTAAELNALGCTVNGNIISMLKDTSALTYQHEPQTLYAQWEPASADKNYYTNQVYYQKLDGSYELIGSSNVDAEAGTVINNPKFSVPGFTFNAEHSTASITVSADNSSVLKSYYDRNKYTLTYSYTDQSDLPQNEEYSVTYGADLPACDQYPNGPYKEGYHFTAWVWGDAAAPTKMPAEDVTLTPKYEKNTYTYIFDAVEGTFSDGNRTKSFVYNYGDAPEAVENPSAVGMDFVAWDIVMPEAVTKDLTFTAIYNTKEFTLTFMDGETEIEHRTVFYGDEITDENVPADYKASKWALANGTVVDFPYTVTDNVTLYAVDGTNVYNLIYLVDGETYKVVPTVYNSKIELIDGPEKPGYTFSGWENQEHIPEFMPSDDFTIKGKMNPNDITVSFYKGYIDAGTGLIDEMTGKCDEPLTAPADPTRDGYTFAGWEPSVPMTYPTEDMSITAKWNPVSFTINFVDSDDSAILTQSVPCGSSVTPPTPSKAGYTFDKWVDESGAEVDFDTFTMPANDVTVKAVWTPNKYTITFDTDGGVPETMEPITLNYGESFNPPANPTKEGATFAGWLDADTGVLYAAIPSKMPLGGLKLKAQWSDNTHTAIFNANGGEFADGETLKTYDVAYGSAITAPADPTRENYTFTGWTPAIPDVMPDENVTFTATWEPVQVGTVDYKINVITINPATGEEIKTVKSFTANDGETVEIVPVGGASSADKVHYYELLTDSEGNVPDTTNAGNRTTLTVVKEGPTANELTVYFKLKTVTVNFDPNGGKLVTGSEEVMTISGTYGQTLTAPVPTRTGYNFDGWDKQVSDTFVSDETYTARWTLQEHYAIFTVNGTEYTRVLVKYNQPITAPYYEVPAGKVFSGWNINGAVMGTQDMTFDASLTDARYSVTYKVISSPAGAPASPATGYANYGDKVTVSTADMSVEGYTFSGWTLDGVAVTEFDMPARDVTLIGTYSLNSYTISFDTDGGNDVPDQNVYYNNPVSILPTPVKDGFTFAGWTDEQGNDVTLPFNMPAKNITLKAKWTEVTVDQYTITYKFTGEAPLGVTAPATQVAEVGATVTVADLPAAVEGYTFSGWYYNNKLTESFVMPANNVEIEGRWTIDEIVPEKYVLALDANGGEFADGSDSFAKEFEENETVLTPGDPTRDGYKFVGWTNADGSIAGIPVKMPATNISLEAKWAELFDVMYVVDGDLYDLLTDAAAEGDPVPATTKGEPEKEGFVFAGWVDKETGEPVTVMPGTDLTLVATWDAVIPDTYKLSYYDGTTLLKTEQYAAGADIPDYILDAKMGYTFKGWTGMPEDKKMPAEDLVVFADWQAKEHTITLNACGGKFEDESEQFVETVAYGTPLADVVPAEPTREGYTFDGWANNDGMDSKIPDTMPDINVTLNAKWIANRYTITFDSNGGSPVAPITLPCGEEVTAPEDPTRDGFIFLGWLPEVPETMPAKDMTLVAQWKADPSTVIYNLVYDANGGMFSDKSTEKYFILTEGEAIPTVETPTKEGFEFVKWNGVPEDGKMPASNLTITAEWKEIEVKSHKVTYYLVKGGTAYDEKTFEEGETIVNPADPTVEGFTFKGWADENGNPLPDKMGETDLEAFAILEVNKYKVTYIVDGSVYEEYTEVAYGSEVPVPEAPAGDATRLFAGWQPTVEAVMPAHDLTYTATWVDAPVEGEEFSVTYTVDGEVYRIYVVKEGDSVPVPENPKKFGYKFVGWEPEVPSTMPAENLEFAAQFEVDKTFVAVVIGGTAIAGGVIAAIAGVNAAWITGISIVGGIIAIVGVAELVKHTHTVTYIVDGEVYKTYKVVEGTKIPVPADPEKDGAKFKGWNPEVPERMGNSDLTFEATWEDVGGIIDVVIPDTGSAAGIAAFAVISGAAAAAYVIVSKKKKED